MIEYLIACVSGVAIGYTAGLLPGIGLTVMMITFFPVLMKLSMTTLLVFYCCMMSACQFGGSVTALAVGLPGETNSFPLLKIRQEIIDAGQQSQALFLCAAGHLIGAVSTFVLSYLIVDIIAANTGYLKTIVLVSVCFTGAVLCLWFSDSPWYFTIPAMAAAWVLAKAGIDQYTHERFLTFGNDYLAGGLPNIAVIMGIYAIPGIVKSILDPYLSVESLEFDTRITGIWSLVSRNIGSIFRGNWIGFFSGLIPYVGVDLSSYMAYYAERYLKRDHMAQVAAAETASNAAGISVLLPVLIYGIAIQPSESILLELANTTSQVVNWVSVQPIFHVIAVWLIVANLLSFLLSWNFAGWIVNQLSLLGRLVPWMLLMLCTYSVWSIGMDYGQGLYYITVLCVFSIVGYIFRNQDMLPFVFVFMLQDKLEPALMRLSIIYLN
jgi:putative tricarboxylic transport membrane protein